MLIPISTVCGNTYHRGELVRRAHSWIAETRKFLAETECRLSRDVRRLKPATHFWMNLRLHKCTQETEHKGKVKAREALKTVQTLTMIPIQICCQRMEALLAHGRWALTQPNHSRPLPYTNEGLTPRESRLNNRKVWQKYQTECQDNLCVKVSFFNKWC